MPWQRAAHHIIIIMVMQLDTETVMLSKHKMGWEKEEEGMNWADDGHVT